MGQGIGERELHRRKGERKRGEKVRGQDRTGQREERGGREGALEICRGLPLSVWLRIELCMCKGKLPGTKERTTEKESGIQ